MPAKQRELTPEEQKARFEEAVANMEADGELNPIDAARLLDSLVTTGARKRQESTDS